MSKSRKFRDDDDINYMGNLGAPVGNTFIEMLMASPNQTLPDPFDPNIAEAIWDAIELLEPKHKFVVESMFVWGKSYNEIAEMMGYNSKATAHGIMRTALKNLKETLEQDPRLNVALGKQDTNMTQTWADAAWKHIRTIDRGSEFEPDPTMFPLWFDSLGEAVRNNDHERMTALCNGIGHEAARVMNKENQWDMEAMLETLVRKQHDYGHNNILAFGLTGVAVRISDKIARYQNIINAVGDNKVSHETYLDTLMDMVGYSVIARMLADNTFQLPLLWEF